MVKRQSFIISFYYVLSIEKKLKNERKLTDGGAVY